jgi:hypothetical protein
MTFKIAFFSDTHIDYSSGRKWGTDGVNLRVRDGHSALQETVTQIIASDVDLAVQGGDLFHASIPSVRGIVAVREQFDRLYRAGIPVVGITGNHDFPNTRLRLPATASVNDPEHNINIYTDPSVVLTPADGIVIHAVGHAGLLGTPVEPELRDGEINILVSHGAADIEGHEIFHCVDSPAEAVIPRTTLQQDFAVTLLGHYHGQGALPRLQGTTNKAFYAGSALRRGFSDAQGERGWLLVEIEPDGTVQVSERHIRQRPQFDLPAISAHGLTGAEVDEMIRLNLSTIDMKEAPIVRQRVLDCPLSTRKGVDAKSLNELTMGALSWQLEFQRPVDPEHKQTIDIDGIKHAKKVSLPDAWREFVAADSSLTEFQRTELATRGRELLEGGTS